MKKWILLLLLILLAVAGYSFAGSRSITYPIVCGASSGGTSDHSALSNLDWTSSGHTGTANKIAGFDASGGATEYDASKYYSLNISDPYSQYNNDTQICIDPNTNAETITRIDITCDADPATELDWNLKYADDFISLANATLIVAMDTTNGTATITSGWNDDTVPAGKCVYIEFDAQPDANITQVAVKIKRTE